MTLLSDFYSEEYNTQRDQWEKALKSELKLEDIRSKTFKKNLDGGQWPTLSLERVSSVHLPVWESWKKAAQTYVSIPNDKIATWVREDLESGVRCFFFYRNFLTDEQEKKIRTEISSFPKSNEVEIFIIGGNDLIAASEIEYEGGNDVQELSLLATKVIENLHCKKLNIGVYVDSQFFKNIAKIRALKLLTTKISQEAKIDLDFKVVALNSMREWTLYDRYSNMLRNDAQVASAYIGGADFTQSSGYQCLFELEEMKFDEEHSERSRRMARNTSHILALESMLGVVHDAAYGSYHLENLSDKLASDAWTLMQRILPLSEAERQSFLNQEVSLVRQSRLERIKTRKQVLAGVNDFANVKEVLGLAKVPNEKFFRVARGFEELRFAMEQMAQKPRVYIALYGEYSALSARINFVKNYFELLGLEVNDPSNHKHDLDSYIEDIQSRSEEVIVVCASDADYPQLTEIAPKIRGQEKFVAGKTDIPGLVSIYGGQNIFEVLSSFVQRWSEK